MRRLCGPVPVGSASKLQAVADAKNELAYLTWVLEELARREWFPEAATRLIPGAWLAM